MCRQLYLDIDAYDYRSIHTTSDFLAPQFTSYLYLVNVLYLHCKSLEASIDVSYRLMCMVNESGTLTKDYQMMCVVAVHTIYCIRTVVFGS